MTCWPPSLDLIKNLNLSQLELFEELFYFSLTLLIVFKKVTRLDTELRDLSNTVVFGILDINVFVKRDIWNRLIFLCRNVFLGKQFPRAAVFQDFLDTISTESFRVTRFIWNVVYVKPSLPKFISYFSPVRTSEYLITEVKYFFSIWISQRLEKCNYSNPRNSAKSPWKFLIIIVPQKKFKFKSNPHEFGNSISNSISDIVKLK